MGWDGYLDVRTRVRHYLGGESNVGRRSPGRIVAVLCGEEIKKFQLFQHAKEHDIIGKDCEPILCGISSRVPHFETRGPKPSECFGHPDVRVISVKSLLFSCSPIMRSSVFSCNDITTRWGRARLSGPTYFRRPTLRRCKSCRSARMGKFSDEFDGTSISFVIYVFCSAERLNDSESKNAAHNAGSSRASL